MNISLFIKKTTLILLVSVLNLYSQDRLSNQNITSEKDYFNIVLARPSDKSITISALPLKNLSVYCEYKKSSESSYTKTEAKTVIQGVPLEIELSNLYSNTLYNYHVLYTENVSNGYTKGDEHSFQTKRTSGSAFSFVIEADPHPYDKKGSHTMWDITFANMLKDKPDFLIDLGDTFGDDHNPFTITSAEVKQLHLDNRTHFGVACHSIPLLFCLGNHEGESGYYLLQTPPNNLGTYGTIWRKYYYPNPEPNSFYSGNSVADGYGMGLPQNYYSFEWGDALFVVLDAYRGYTANAKPRGWEWTLGQAQYDWFRETLKNSKAKYKFVFTHHILGETRGAVAVAQGFEWGGYEADGRTNTFSANRPGWEAPIHQLMKTYGVNIFFQGHDHLFAKEELDGIVYQEVPMPSDSTYQIGMLANADAYISNQLDGTGHIRVTVSSSNVLVEYVGAYLPKDENATNKNYTTRFSYTVKSNVSSVDNQISIPTEFKLEQNYPNPFNPGTVISYQLSVASHVLLKVYDVLGHEVSTLVDEFKPAGRYNSQFSIQNLPAGRQGSQLPSGVYFYRLVAENFIQTKKAILLK
jgi:hypothetical protein